IPTFTPYCYPFYAKVLRITDILSNPVNGTIVGFSASPNHRQPQQGDVAKQHRCRVDVAYTCEMLRFMQ
ncbi:hypothetical protein, partial [Azonexus hydrophilus]